VCLELLPGNRPGLGTTAKRGEQVALQSGQFEVRRPGSRILTREYCAAFEPAQRVRKPVACAIQLREGETVLRTQVSFTREGNVCLPVFLDEVYGAKDPASMTPPVFGPIAWERFRRRRCRECGFEPRTDPSFENGEARPYQRPRPPVSLDHERTRTDHRPSKPEA
jgi:hypothetical protein